MDTPDPTPPPPAATTMSRHGAGAQARPAPDRAADAGTGGPSGIYLYGLVRAGGRLGAQRVHAAGDEFLRVRYRELVALARPMPFHLPALEKPDLVAHQRAVDRVMRRGTILPAPPGVVFRGRRPLLRFLEDQYLALEEGLGFVDGHWELRLHISIADGAGPGLEPRELAHLAAHTYGELRRLARAAVPFPRDGQRLLSAAFLVDRTRWIQFVERAEDLGSGQPGLALDVTGPWPPYDFVRIGF